MLIHFGILLFYKNGSLQLLREIKNAKFHLLLHRQIGHKLINVFSVLHFIIMSHVRVIRFLVLILIDLIGL